jgi:hypothetical protein
VSDKEFIQTAGLDGFAFLRVAQLGVQIFFPVAVVVWRDFYSSAHGDL